MKKQDIIISDDALTKEQKEKLEQEFFERQQKELHKGRLFLTASVIALYANVVITVALYPLRSIFFIKDPKKPDDFALPESAIMFITVLIIFIILCINIGMAIATNICAAKKKGARPAAAVSFILAEVINLLIAVMQLSSALTYSDVRKHSVLLCVRSRHIHNDIQVEYFGLYLCGGVENVRKSRKRIIYLKSKCL